MPLTPTGIPVMRLTLAVGKVKDDINRDTNINVTVVTENGTGSSLSSFASNLLPNGFGRIKGRGNATWTDFAKKPYTFTSTNSSFTKVNTTPFGLPTDSSFTMLALLCYDKSGIRPQLGAELGHQLNQYWYSSFQVVELYINDEYLGLYLFCEKVQQARLPKKYVVEQQPANYIKIDEKSFVDDRFQKTFGFKVPDSPTDADTIAAKDIIDNGYDTIYDFPLTDTVNGYRSKWDVDETVKQVLLKGFSKDIDVNNSSWYFTFDDTTNKLSLGPGWDFDNAFGNFVTSSQHGPYNFRTTNDDIIGLQCPWLGILMGDPYFNERTRLRWNSNKTAIAAIWSGIDAYKSSLQDAIARDKVRWGWQEDNTQETNTLKTFVNNRQTYYSNSLYMPTQDGTLQNSFAQNFQAPVNIAGATRPTLAHEKYFDDVNIRWRAFRNTTEAHNWSVAKAGMYRVVQNGGTLDGGVWTGGVEELYQYKGGIQLSNLKLVTDGVGSARVVYLSTIGCTSQADLSMGSTTFGPDYTTIIQTELDKANATTPLYIINDCRVAATQLQFSSNTTWENLQGCGVIQPTGTSKQLIINKNRSGTPNGNSITQENIIIRGGIFNQSGYIVGATGNGATGNGQLKYVGNIGWNTIIRMSGVRNVRIENVTFRNPRTFCSFINNCENIYYNGLKMEISPDAPLGNYDGVKTCGPAKGVTMITAKGATKDDLYSIVTEDVFWPDTLPNGASDTQAGLDFSASYGDVTDVVYDGITLLDSGQGGRILNAGPSRLDRVILRNVSGKLLTGVGLIFDNFVASGNANYLYGASGAKKGNVGTVTIDGWNIDRPNSAGNAENGEEWSEIYVSIKAENIIIKNYARSNYTSNQRSIKFGQGAEIQNVRIIDAIFANNTGSYVPIQNDGLIRNLFITATNDKGLDTAGSFAPTGILLNNGTIQNLSINGVITSTATTVNNESTFTATNGTDLTSYSPEVGDMWQNWVGTFSIVDNKARAATLVSNLAQTVVNTSLNQGTVEYTDVLSIGGGFQAIVRATDTDNYVALNIDTTNAILYNVVGGVATSFSTVSAGFTNNTPHKIEVVLAGTSITVKLDGTTIINGATIPTAQNGRMFGWGQTGSGVSGNVTLDRFRFLNGTDNGLGNVVSTYNQSSFTAANNTNIVDYTPEQGSDWVNLVGSFDIQNNAASSKTFVGNIAQTVVDAGTADTKVTYTAIADAGGNSVAQLVLRATDANNFIAVNITNNNVAVFNVVSGTATQDNTLSAGSSLFTYGVPHNIEVTMNGTNMVLKIDGTTVVTGTAPVGNTGTLFGFGQNGSSTAGDVTVSAYTAVSV